MRKLLKFILWLITLCSGIQLSQGKSLNCEFVDQLIDFSYTCIVYTLEMKYKNTYIDGYNGVHKLNKNDNDVKAIRIRDTNAKFIPAIFSFSLTAFEMYNTQLDEVKDEIFFGMQNLELLDLSRNRLTSVPSDAFYTLAKLKKVNLGENELEQIHNELFTNNLNLEKIVLGGNKIKYIGSGLFNGLMKLNQVLLQDNICIDKSYYGNTEIIKLKEEIIKYCVNPYEIPSTTTTTTTTENPLEILRYEYDERIRSLEKDLYDSKKGNVEEKISYTEEINCEFKDTEYGSLGNFYSCKVSSFENVNDKIIVVGFTGVHLLNKNDDDIKSIWISGTNIKQIPENLGLLFNLYSFEIDDTKLIEIKSKDFEGMKDLIYLNLGVNKITSIPNNVFSTLPKLKVLILSRNELEELSNSIFTYNLQLERIYLDGNKIKSIGIELFNGLTNLMHVSLNGNICVSKLYRGAAQIIEMKNDIQLKC